MITPLMKGTESMRRPRFSAALANTSAARCNNSAFRCVIWFGWTSNHSASCTRVWSLFTAASATLALNAAEWHGPSISFRHDRALPPDSYRLTFAVLGPVELLKDREYSACLQARTVRCCFTSALTFGEVRYDYSRSPGHSVGVGPC